MQLTSNESTREYSFAQVLSKKCEIPLIKLDGNIEVNNKIDIIYTNSIFYYSVNGVDRNNNLVNEVNLIDIPANI